MFLGNFRELCDYLNKSSEVLVKNSQLLDNVLETLNIQQHSLGVLAVLCAKFSAPTTSTLDNRYTQVQEFILGCNGEQIRFAPDTCKNLHHHLSFRYLFVCNLQLPSCATILQIILWN